MHCPTWLCISLFLPPGSFHPLKPLATSVLLLISNVAGTPIPCCMWKLNKWASAYWRYTSALIKWSVQLDSRITLHDFWTTKKEFNCCKRECEILARQTKVRFLTKVPSCWWTLTSCCLSNLEVFIFYDLQREACSAAFAHGCFIRFTNFQSLLIYNRCFNLF